MKLAKKIFLSLALLLVWLPNIVLAVPMGGLEKTGEAIGYKASSNAAADLPAKIGYYINVFVSLLGMVFMVLIWIGAFGIIGAGGNDAEVKKGRDRIKNGAIGIFIIMIAYFITKFILLIVSGTGYFNSTQTQATSFNNLVKYLLG